MSLWENQQLQLALKKAEVQLEKKLKHFSGQANQNASLMENASLYMPLVAGVGLVGASTVVIRGSYDAAHRALLITNELEASLKRSEEFSQNMLGLIDDIKNADLFIHLYAKDSKDFDGYLKEMTNARPLAQQLTQGMRANVLSFISHAEITQQFINDNISGEECFHEIANEKEAPILCRELH